MLPPWLRSRLPSEPTRTFVAFTDAVARLLELPPARPAEVYVRRYGTDRVWMVWRYKTAARPCSSSARTGSSGRA